MDAILPMPRAPHIVAGELLAAEKWSETLRSMMGEFAALDTRPLLMSEGSVTRIGPDPVPEQLRECYRDAMVKLHALQWEYANVRPR